MTDFHGPTTQISESGDMDDDGYERSPLEIVRAEYFEAGSQDLRTFVEAAQRLALAVILESSSLQSRNLVCAEVLAESMGIEPTQIDTWWLSHELWASGERIESRGANDEFLAALADPRWRTHRARAVWYPTLDDRLEDTGDASADVPFAWFVDFADQPV